MTGVFGKGRWLLRALLAIGLGLLPAGLWAATLQPGNLLDEWSTADGLPVEGISGIVIGSDGYVWLATFGGLVRFDGAQFQTFDSVSHRGLDNDRLISLIESAGRLWAVTESRTLVSFDARRFRAWGEADGLPPGKITLEPLLGDGTLWVGTAQGLAEFDPATARWRQRAQTAPVRAILAQPGGRLWVGTADGLLRADGAGLPLVRATAPGLPHATIAALSADRDGALWVATGAGVVRLVDGRAQPVADFSNVMRIDVDDDGSVVLVAPMVDYRWQNGRIATLPSNHGEPRQVPVRVAAADGTIWHNRRGLLTRNGAPVLELPCAVNALATDTSGALWVASQCGGLQRVREGFISALTEVDGRPLGAIYGLAETPDRALWMAALDGSVAVRQADGAQARLAGREGFGDNCLGTFLLDTDGTLWAGRTRLCHMQGGVCSDPPGLPAALNPGAKRNSGPLSADIRAVYRDRSGGLWVGSVGGLWSEQGGHWRVEQELSSVHVRAFAQTRDGSLWLGTTGDGLYRRSANGRYVQHGLAEGLSSLLIRAMHEDADGHLWVATENRGLCRSVAQGEGAWRFACLGRAQGLWSDSLHQLLEDGQGRFWISSNQGLMQAARSDLDAVIEGRAPQVYVRAYTERDGLPKRELNGGVQGAGIVLADGRLAFPTQNGVALVDPERAPHAPGRMRAVIEDVLLPDGRAFDPLTGTGQTRLELPRGERSFALHYTGLSPELSSLAYFRYRLLPDPAWVPLGNNRQLNLNRLPPGAHTVEIVALNSSGEAGQGAQLQLYLPPWPYETQTFRYGVPALLLLLALAWGWRQYGIAQRRQRTLEGIVSARTVELSDALATVHRKNAEIARFADSKARFFANISHELRTPLTLISGPLRDAARGTPIAARTQGIMLVNAQRLERLVTQLLDLERIDAGRFPLRPDARDLAALLRESVEAFGSLAVQQQVQLDYIGRIDALTMRFDPDQIARVFGNLLSNALKFTPPGGRIAVDLVADDSSARVCVDDTGPGVPPQWRERIFDRFSQVGAEATRSREGAGLGLVLCRELAALHGGRLWVEERPGGGSRFVFVLPRDGAAAMLAEGAPEFADEAHEQDSALALDPPEAFALGTLPSRRILVAEDNPDLRAYVTGILARDHHVLQAEDGEQALDIALAELPDLIVSDIMMPRRDGLALARALREREETAGIPLIFLTARASDADEIAALASGADQFLRKPFDAEVLRAHVAAALHGVERLRRRFAAQVAEETDAGRADALPAALDPGGEAAAAPADAFAAKALAWLQRNLHDEDVSIPAMALALHVSRTTLNRRLSAATGESPGAALRRLRLERADGLLTRGEGTVSEVAYAVGYASLAVFSRAYREHFGRSPSSRTRA